MLIDPGSTLNLVSEKLVKYMACNVYPNKNIVVKVANGDHHRLTGYVRVALTLSGVRKIIEAYVVSGNTSYSMLLGRAWLRSVRAIGFYGYDEYYIADTTGTYHELPFSSKTYARPPEVMLGCKCGRHLG